MNNKGKYVEIIDDGSLQIYGVVRKGLTSGIGLDFKWEGTKLGVKREDQAEYEYVDLKADNALELTKESIIEALGYTPANTDDLIAHIIDLDIHVTEEEKQLITTIEGKADKTYVDTINADLINRIKVLSNNHDAELKIINDNLTALDNNKLDIERYNIDQKDIDDKLSTIPRKTSDLINDSDFINSESPIFVGIQKQIDNLVISKVDQNLFTLEIRRLEDMIAEIDNSGGVDLSEIKADIEDLKTNKADITYVDQKVADIHDKFMALLEFKVDKVIGKGLSTNDYTDEDRANVQKIPSKADKSDIPTKLSELEIDIEVGKNYDAAIKKLEDNKVDKVDGKELSTNDYTDDDKLKLASLKPIQRISDLEQDIPYLLSKDLDNIKQDISNNTTLINQEIARLEAKIDDIDIPDDEIAAIKLSIQNLEQLKADKLYVVDEINRLEVLIHNLDPPEIDLSEIKADVQNLKDTKADLSYVNSEIATVNKKIDDIVIPPEVDLTDINSNIDMLKESKADKTAIPTKLSELSNDTKFITIQDVPEIDLSEVTESIELNNQEISELKAGKANKADIPTKLGQLTNDMGYLTGKSEEISSLENDVASLKSTKADTTLVTGEIARLEKAILELDIPEEVDLTPINKSIEELNTNKIDRAEFEKRLGEEIMALIDGAPEALDTLGELAKALGEDANFSVTVTNMITEKVSNEKFNTEIERLEKRINNLDIPEGVDLTPVYAEIDKLKSNKLDVSKFNEEMAKVATIEYVVVQLENKANVEDIPTEISELINDAKYITLEEVPKVDLTDIKKDILDLQQSKANKVDVESALAGKSDISHNHNDLYNTKDEIDSKLLSKQSVSEKNQPNGYVGLDSNGKISLSHIPDTAKQSTYIVQTVDEMNDLTGIISGDKCFITTVGDSYIYDGSAWKVIAKADWENINLDWGNIKNKPISTQVQIDDTVSKAHEHTNKAVLDKITDNTISGIDSHIKNKDIHISEDDRAKWDTVDGKADKSYVDSEIDSLSQKNNTQDIEISKKINTTDVSAVGKTGKYEDIIGTPLIPSKTSELNNDNKFITSADLSGLNDEVSALKTGKVDKVDGKTLTSNDYTNAEKLKLSKIEDEANKTTKTSQLTNDSNYVDKAYVDGELGKVQTDLSKYMLSEDFVTKVGDTTKLKDSTGAQTDVVESILSNKSATDNKVDKVSGKGLSTNDYSTSEKSEVATIKNKADKSYTDTELSKKVDKVTGKQLSTNDYTTAEKTKLAGISAGANKVTKVSELTNDTGFITLADIPTTDYPVTSVNMKTGDVILKGSDIKLDESTEKTISEKITEQTLHVEEKVAELHEKDNTQDVIIAQKASKSDIPTKLSQLEIDIEVGKNYDEEISEIQIVNQTQTEQIDELVESGNAMTQSIQDLRESKADKSEIPTKLSKLNNDSGFITSSSVPTKISNLTDDTETKPINYAKRVPIIDTRDISQTPSQIMRGSKPSLSFDFKRRSVVGYPDFDISANTDFCYVLTIFGWSDKSGGYPTQISFGKDKVGIRTGTSNTEWSGWRIYSDDTVLNNIMKNYVDVEINTLDNKKADKSDILSPYHLGSNPPTNTSVIWVKK